MPGNKRPRTEEQVGVPLKKTLRDFYRSFDDQIADHQKSMTDFKDFYDDFMEEIKDQQANSVNLDLIKDLEEKAKEVKRSRDAHKEAVKAFTTAILKAQEHPDALISYFEPKANGAKSSESKF